MLAIVSDVCGAIVDAIIASDEDYFSSECYVHGCEGEQHYLCDQPNCEHCETHTK